MKFPGVHGRSEGEEKEDEKPALHECSVRNRREMLELDRKCNQVWSSFCFWETQFGLIRLFTGAHEDQVLARAGFHQEKRAGEQFLFFTVPPDTDLLGFAPRVPDAAGSSARGLDFDEGNTASTHHGGDHEIALGPKRENAIE